MWRRLIFLAFCLPLAAAAQNVAPAAGHARGPRSLSRAEGRQILAAVFTVDTDSEHEADCSHLVHEVYRQAGFPYEYASSRELYTGSASFTRVRAPQTGDLVVWRGHVGIVIDPKEHSFFSSVRSGPDTQFYDSRYWRSRGSARFYRYVIEKPLGSGRTLEASANHGLVNERSKQPNPAPAALPNSALTVAPSGSETVEAPRTITLQVAGKNPAPDEVAAAFAEMNQDSGKSLRTRGLNSPGDPVVVYRELRVSAVQVKGKRGTALVEIESLGVANPDTATGSQPRWKECPLEFEKTKRGWVMRPVSNAAYVPREVALQLLSARLADLAQALNATPEQEREQKQIIRFLNVLVSEDSRAVSAQSQ